MTIKNKELLLRVIIGSFYVFLAYFILANLGISAFNSIILIVPLFETIRTHADINHDTFENRKTWAEFWLLTALICSFQPWMSLIPYVGNLTVTGFIITQLLYRHVTTTTYQQLYEFVLMQDKPYETCKKNTTSWFSKTFSAVKLSLPPVISRYIL